MAATEKHSMVEVSVTIDYLGEVFKLDNECAVFEVFYHKALQHLQSTISTPYCAISQPPTISNLFDRCVRYEGKKKGEKDLSCHLVSILDNDTAGILESW